LRVCIDCIVSDREGRKGENEGAGIYHFFPPRCWIDIFNRSDCFEDSGIIDKDVGVAILFFHLLEECNDRRRVREVGRDAKGLYGGVGLGNRLSDLAKLVGSASH
jgi:hypothetical protein